MHPDIERRKRGPGQGHRAPENIDTNEYRSIAAGTQASVVELHGIRFQNQESNIATPEQAWERLRRAILDQQTKPSIENALRIRRWSDALIAALNEGGAG